MIASKENLIGSFAQRMDSNRERVGLISMIGLYHLPLDYLSRWQQRVQAVTLDQIRVQAARYLQTGTVEPRAGRPEIRALNCY